MNGLRLAVGTLTTIPVPAPRHVDRTVGRDAMLVAPLVGLLLGLVAAAVVALADGAGAPPAVTAALAVSALALLTRGLHLDGLADTADGLACGYDRERALTVMRRGDVGPAGAVTLVLVLVLQVGALAAAVDAGHGPTAVAVAVVAGRAVLPLVCVAGVPAARGEGLGATVAGTVPVPAAALVALVTLLAVGAGAGLLGGPPGVTVLAVAVGWAASVPLLLRCVRRLGGVTGDVLGAAVEVTTTAALVLVSLG